MARALIAVGVALVLCIGTLVLVVFLGRSEEKLAVDNLLAENLSKAIGTAEQDRDGRVDLTEVARFTWDEVLLVARGAPREATSEALGFDWKDDAAFGGSETFIFLSGGKVVRFADYRGEGRFEGFEEPVDRLPRDRSMLRVRSLVVTP